VPFRPVTGLEVGREAPGWPVRSNPDNQATEDHPQRLARHPLRRMLQQSRSVQEDRSIDYLFDQRFAVFLGIEQEGPLARFAVSASTTRSSTKKPRPVRQHIGGRVKKRSGLGFRHPLAIAALEGLEILFKPNCRRTAMRGLVDFFRVAFLRFPKLFRRPLQLGKTKFARLDHSLHQSALRQRPRVWKPRH